MYNSHIVEDIKKFHAFFGNEYTKILVKIIIKYRQEKLNDFIIGNFPSNQAAVKIWCKKKCEAWSIKWIQVLAQDLCESDNDLVLLRKLYEDFGGK